MPIFLRADATRSFCASFAEAIFDAALTHSMSVPPHFAQRSRAALASSFLLG